MSSPPHQGIHAMEKKTLIKNLQKQKQAWCLGTWQQPQQLRDGELGRTVSSQPESCGEEREKGEEKREEGRKEECSTTTTATPL